MADPFARFPTELDSPGREFFSITPVNGTDLPIRPRALWVGGAGNVVARGLDNIAVTFFNLTVGWHPIGPVRIDATGTTATGIVGIT